MHNNVYTSKHLHTTISETDLGQFDEWCRENRLPRGAGIGALVRLVRALSKATIVQHPDEHRPVGLFPGSKMVGQVVAEAGQRFVELDPSEPT